MNTFFFTLVQPAIPVNQRTFIAVQVMRLYRFNHMVDFCMADQIINGRFKKVGQCNQRADIRFYCVVFIFIDRLLTDADNIGKLLLTDAFSQSQFFKFCTIAVILPK